MRNRLLGLACTVAVFISAVASGAGTHNVVLFVPDGLRSRIVDATTAPALEQLRTTGVDFRNGHSLFPTFTTANASAFATGHGLADTGDFSNVIYTGFPVLAAGGSVTPFVENDGVLREMNDHFAANYLNEASIVAAARAQGYSTALIGKLGPVAVFDVSALKGQGTLIVDDVTGSPGKGVPLPVEWQNVFKHFQIAPTAPSRADNGNSGTAITAGTSVPDTVQEQYFVNVITKAVLPHFKDIGKPFLLVFWSRDPDGTQHNQGDSLHALTPGINGPTSMSAIRVADTALAGIQQALQALDLADSTDIIVAADHGFSTTSKTSATSVSTKPNSPYPAKDVVPGELPPGFLAIDLFQALRAKHPTLKLFDPDNAGKQLNWQAGEHPVRGNAVLGEEARKPKLVVASNGGSDLIYVSTDVSKREAEALVHELVASLADEDYVSGVFVDQDRFGDVPGTLGTSAVGVGGGAAITPHPDVIVNFTSRTVADCHKEATLCTEEVADTVLQTGQGMHGSFSRADTWNFMAATGPDFRSHYVDALPASNADIGATIAHLLKLDLTPNRTLVGRVLTEALTAAAAGTTDATPTVTRTLESSPTANGLRTLLRTESVGVHTYYDAGGFRGRTVGLE